MRGVPGGSVVGSRRSPVGSGGRFRMMPRDALLPPSPRGERRDPTIGPLGTSLHRGSRSRRFCGADCCVFAGVSIVIAWGAGGNLSSRLRCRFIPSAAGGAWHSHAQNAELCETRSAIVSSGSGVWPWRSPRGEGGRTQPRCIMRDLPLEPTGERQGRTPEPPGTTPNKVRTAC